MAVARLSIDDLAEIVKSRKGADPGTSYTAKLLDRGVGQCAKKFGEEAVETVIAAMDGDKQAICSEAADVLYHLVVLLAAADVELEDIYAELGRREGTSGIVEKARRGT
ncbi:MULTISPECIES: phosphoribosyl-ATP diphosphatase [Microbaculum]|uniref:Phosphoribosyl-ATP pyrophosphatase n=1 Tax=Microbaculum marinisediminis TaxID=2931392 RepID=A0AAW5QYU2_9HYPH|nr:phosphoribosyl-ATP diphosphatase [Microbaculum sp. A6E488]MCT8972190.1 phosphoribosyl-ATP diphosphatase [Microbaculum sp. A6E488]